VDIETGAGLVEINRVNFSYLSSRVSLLIFIVTLHSSLSLFSICPIAKRGHVASCRCILSENLHLPLSST